MLCYTKISKIYAFEECIPIKLPFFQMSFTPSVDLLKVTGAPNNGTYGSLHHMLTPEFLKSLPPREEEVDYEITPRYFPKDYEKALAECKDCQCPHCEVSRKTKSCSLQV